MGFFYAIVHVRGGGYLGGEWYRFQERLKTNGILSEILLRVNYLRENDVIDSNSEGLFYSRVQGIIVLVRC